MSLAAVLLYLTGRGTDTMQAECAVPSTARVSRELVEIDAVLERLYRAPERLSLCEDSGREIPFEWPALVPWARTCAEAGA